MIKTEKYDIYVVKTDSGYYQKSQSNHPLAFARFTNDINSAKTWRTKPDIDDGWDFNEEDNAEILTFEVNVSYTQKTTP